MSKPKRPDLSMAFASLAASAQPGQRDDVTAPFPLDASAPSPDNVIMLQTDSAHALSPGNALMPFPDGARGLQRDVVQAFKTDDTTTSTPDSAQVLQPATNEQSGLRIVRTRKDGAQARNLQQARVTRTFICGKQRAICSWRPERWICSWSRL